MSNARKLADNLPTEGQLAGRNVIVNSAMMVSQRGTSFASVGNVYTLDRFHFYKQNAGSAFTVSQSSVTDLAGFANALKVDCTTADTSTASNEQAYIGYKAEGQDLQRFQKGHSTALGFTLSFYVKTNKTGVYTVKMYDRDNNRDVSGSYTVADANWNRYTISFPADTTGKFDDDNASSLEIFFNLVNGSDTQGGTLNTAWRSVADASSATGQVNFADSTSNDWEITGIQLEAGQASPFEHELVGVTMSKCQRYYHNSFHAGKTPGVDTHSTNQIITTSWNDGNCNFPPYPNAMRGAPTITLRSRNTNNTAKVYQDSSEKSAYVSGIGTKGGEYVQITSGGAGLWTAFNYECDAEL